MSQEKKIRTFFQEYQQKNVLNLLQKTIEDIVNEWLKNADDFDTKLKNLHQLAELTIDSSTVPDSLPLPDFIKRLWLSPHQTIKSLDKTIRSDDIKQLIKDTAAEVATLRTQQNYAPPH